MWESKLCRGCGSLRTPEQFALKDSRTGQRHSQCRECGRRRSREHYRANRVAYIARNRRNSLLLRRRNADVVYEYLLRHPCTSCAESDPVVLEFNHRDPRSKIANVSDLVRSGCSIERLLDEIAKCDVVCANCHQQLTSVARPRHYKRTDGGRLGVGKSAFRVAANARNHELVRQFLLDEQCVDCGERELLVLQFDHLRDKMDHVAWLVGSGCSPARIERELRKCEIRCANCQRRATALVQGWFRALRMRGASGQSNGSINAGAVM